MGTYVAVEAPAINGSRIYHPALKYTMAVATYLAVCSWRYLVRDWATLENVVNAMMLFVSPEKREVGNYGKINDLKLPQAVIYALVNIKRSPLHWIAMFNSYSTPRTSVPGKTKYAGILPENSN